MPAKKWTKQRVIEAIRARDEQGLPLSKTRLDDTALYSAAIRCFGRWQQALVAAGVKKSYVPRRAWTRQRVIDAIRARHEQGLSLVGVRNHDAVLDSAAKRYFGTWQQAVDAAGLEPDLPRRWNRQRVIEALRERQRQGLPIRNVREYDNGLVNAARRHFGSWTAAMSAAGLGEHVRRTGQWSAQRVIEALQSRSEQGLPLKNVAAVDRRLARAAVRIFGSWRAAVLAAGLKPQPRGKWNKELVIAEIQRWHQEGLPLNQVYRLDTRLYAAASTHVGNWHAALRAAGFPRPCRSQRRWSKQAVIDAIRQRHREGLPMTAVGRRDSALHAAALRHWGGWRRAMVAAGLQPEVRKTWSREIIVRQIQERHRKGLTLANLAEHDGALSSAAYLYFGSWNEALRAAGLKPKQPKWDRQRVIDEVRAWHASGRPLAKIWTEYQGLGAAARRHIGCWHEVLTAAGLASKPQKKWSPQRVIKELQAWRREGLPRNAMGDKYQGLKSAVQRYFGRWSDALAAAGLEPLQRRKWSRQRVIQAIQNRHVRGLPTQRSAQQSRTLADAATRYFGNWPNALEAAGVLPAREKPKPREKWSKASVIAAIQDRHERGLPLANVRKDNASLSNAAMRYFGGWREAMIAAGLQPQQRCWDRQRIIAEIQLRQRRGQTINGVWRDDGSLHCAARHHFGSWHDALLAAGLASADERPRPRRWSRQRVIDEIQALYREGLPLTCTWPANRFLAGAAKRHLGGWGKALAAAGITPQEARRTIQKRPKEE
jgi:hypothetical protein